MHRARKQALEELALAEHDRRLVPDAPRHVVRPVERPAGAHEPQQERRALSEQPSGDGEERRERDGAGGSRYWGFAFLSSAVIAGTISWRSPITA
jgi:hypothetical protein